MNYSQDTMNSWNLNPNQNNNHNNNPNTFNPNQNQSQPQQNNSQSPSNNSFQMQQQQSNFVQHFPPQFSQQQPQQQSQQQPQQQSFIDPQMMSLLGAGLNMVSNMNTNSNSNASNSMNMGSNNSDFNSQLAQFAFSAGSNMVQSRLSGWTSWFSLDNIKPYFHVTNSYVLQKIFIMTFPFLHKQWSRKKVDLQEMQQHMLLEVQNEQKTAMDPSISNEEKMAMKTQLMTKINKHQNLSVLYAMNKHYEFPSNDVNAPDLYLPLMASITYILIRGYSSGLSNSFHPEMLANYATVSTISVIIQLCILRTGFFLTNTEGVKLMDAFSLIASQFVPYILTIIFGIFFGKIAFYLGLFVFCSLHALFIGFVLKQSIEDSGSSLDDGEGNGTNSIGKKKKLLLFAFAAIQVFFGFLLIRNSIGDFSLLDVFLASNGSGSSVNHNVNADIDVNYNNHIDQPSLMP